MTPTAQLIAELLDHVEFAYVPARLRDVMDRAAEALARQEELLAEARADIATVCGVSDEIRRDQWDWHEGFWVSKDAAARLSDKLKGE